MDQATRAPAVDEAVPSSRTDLRLLLAPSSATPADALWTAICAGTLRFTELRCEARETRVTLQRRSRAAASGLTQRRQRILELVLCGTSECAVSIDLQLAASTVSQELKHALMTLGLDSRLSALPLPVAQLYHASASHRSLQTLAEPGLETTGSVVVVLPRPERQLGCLAPAELRVCEMMLDGQTYAQIAARRGRSTRTIANQLASVFLKLRVSGRLELLSLLASQRPVLGSTGSSRLS